MRLRQEIHYEADPKRVFAMVTDPEFVRRKCAAGGALGIEVQVSGSGVGPASIVVRSRRVMPTEDFPDVVRRFVGGTVTVEQVDRWDGPAVGGGAARMGRTTVSIAGAPVRLEAVLRLHAAGDGTVQVIDGDLTAVVPLFAAKIERATEPAIRRAAASEQRVARQWLADRGD